MFLVTNMSNGEQRTLNFLGLCHAVGEDLDEAYYTPIFTEHTLIGTDGTEYVVMEDN